MILDTLCGAFSSLWTPAIWLIRGISNLKVYRGGLVGSGKLVLLNGSVSSKNCTLHINVAMVHPCRAVSNDPNSECDAEASDSVHTPLPQLGAANKRQVLSAVAKPPHRVYPWSFPINLSPALMWLQSWSKEGSRRGTLITGSRSESGACRRAARQYPRALRAAEVQRQTAVRGPDCFTWRSVCESDGEAHTETLRQGIQPSRTSAGPTATRVTGAPATSSGDDGNCTKQSRNDCIMQGWVKEGVGPRVTDTFGSTF